MTIYLFKTIVCSGLLWFVYKLILEKEKMFHINRVYLLFCLLFSYIIPLITLNIQQSANSNNNLPVIISSYLPEAAGKPFTNEPIAMNTFANAIWLVYITVASLLMLRFIKNLHWMYRNIKCNKVVLHDGVKLVLIGQNTVPYTFLNYIFVPEADYSTRTLPPAILCHEKAHARQKHSLDILLIELTTVVFWFNPFVHAFKSAVQLNHEFLADEAAIKQHQVLPYQQLLMNTLRAGKAHIPASRFNFITTKKRFIMMTKHSSRLSIAIKMLAAIFVVCFAAYFFSTKVTAQQKTTEQRSGATQTPSGINAVSQDVLEEYNDIIRKYTNLANTKGIYDFSKMPVAEKDRLLQIYLNMTIEQQQKQSIGFIPPPKPLRKIVPSPEQIESWKDAGTYGIWINGRKKANDQLNNFSNTDFSQVLVSKLYGPAKKNVAYSYQVNLMTNDYYRAHYNAAVADTNYVMVVNVSAYKQ